MKKEGLSFLLLVFLHTYAHAQQVQRSWVGFENYFHEAPATAPHAIIPFTASSQDQYDVAVRVTTIDGTAIAGRDYIPIDTEIIFHAGSPTRTRNIEVQLLQNQDAGDRTFMVKLQASFPGEVSQSRGQIPVTITAQPVLKIGRYQTNVFFNWRVSATNVQLQFAHTLPGPWSAITNAPTKIPDSPNQGLALTMTNAGFFRLGPKVAP